MAITRVQHAIAGAVSTTPTVNFGGATTAGNLIVACLAADGVNSVPAGFVLATSVDDAAVPEMHIYYAENAASMSSVTFGLSGSGRWFLQVSEYSGIATSGSLNTYGTLPFSSSLTSPTLTTTVANCVVVFAFSGDASGTWSAPTNSFAIVDQLNGGPGATTCVVDRVVSSAAAYSMSISNGVTPGEVVAGAAFADTAAAANSPRPNITVLRAPIGSIPQLQF